MRYCKNCEASNTSAQNSVWAVCSNKISNCHFKMFVQCVFFHLQEMKLLCYAHRWVNCRTVYQDYHFSRHRWGQSDAILVTGLITPRTSEDWMFHGGPELSTVPSVPDQTMSLTGVSTSRQVLRLRCCSVSGGRWELHGVIKFCGGRPELSVTKWNCEFYSWKCFSFKWEMF